MKFLLWTYYLTVEFNLFFSEGPSCGPRQIVCVADKMGSLPGGGVLLGKECILTKSKMYPLPTTYNLSYIPSYNLPLTYIPPFPYIT
jgi:hypothetical protein